jgi:hypothetical protein
LIGGGIKYFSGRVKSFSGPPKALPCWAAAHLTQRRRCKSTPAAATDSGRRLLDISIQAHTFPACVSRAKKERASEVLPKHSGPTTSVNAPMGSPPRRRSSMDGMPVGDVGRRTFGAGDSADGMRRESEASICTRIALAEDMLSLYIRLNFYSASTGTCPKPGPLNSKCLKRREKNVEIMRAYLPTPFSISRGTI